MPRTCVRSSVEDRLQHYTMVDPNSGCWLWTGSLSGGGYGQTSLNGKVVKAHRLSYEVRVGAIPDGLMVCHKCDVRSCINPDHFFLGTAKDNQQDAVRKGRNPHGSRHGESKLTEMAVRKIREFISGGMKDQQIADKYGVVAGCINLIRHGHSWRHV